MGDQSVSKPSYQAVDYSTSSLPEQNRTVATPADSRERTTMAAAPAPAGNLPVAPPPIAVPPLHPFLEHPGEPPEAWTH